jgi:hypothetical protein
MFMKKILAIALSISMSCNGMTLYREQRLKYNPLKRQPNWPSSSENWKEQFEKIDKKHYDRLAGCKLDLTLHKETRNNVTPGSPTIHHHGYGAHSYKTQNEYLRIAGIPGDVVTFNFPDANNGGILPFWKSSLGQKKDILAALVAQKTMLDCGAKEWGNYGQSRGAAVLINLLKYLQIPHKEWPNKFKNVMTEQQKHVIFKRILGKLVIIETPMMTPFSGIKAHINRINTACYNLPPIKLFTACATPLANFIVAPVITGFNYDPFFGETALSSIDQLPENLKVLVHFQANDTAVGNEYDHLTIKKLVDRLGADNVWPVFAEDGGK